jgi:alpha-ketoglutarate-dependent taurine dioxygenase
MSVTVRPLSVALGAEIVGLDLREPLDGRTWEIVDRAWREHHLLLFRDQELTPEEEIAFATHFGPVSHQGGNMRHARDYMHISNAMEGGAFPNGELLFHLDHVFYDDIMKAIVLYALDVPSRGGDTVFSNGEKAYDLLPADLKRRIAPLQGRHVYDYGVNYGSRRFTADLLTENAVQALHPLAWTNPETKNTVLLASELNTLEVVGLEQAESDQLLAELFTYIRDPRAIYQHAWAVKDLIVWDNRSLQHARTNFDPGEKRTLRRVPIAEFAATGAGV